MMNWEKHGKVELLKSRGGWDRAMVLKQNGLVSGIAIIGGQRERVVPGGLVDPFLEIQDEGRGALQRVKGRLEQIVRDVSL